MVLMDVATRLPATISPIKSVVVRVHQLDYLSAKKIWKRRVSPLFALIVEPQRSPRCAKILAAYSQLCCHPLPLVVMEWIAATRSLAAETIAAIKHHHAILMDLAITTTMVWPSRYTIKRQGRPYRRHRQLLTLTMLPWKKGSTLWELL